MRSEEIEARAAATAADLESRLTAANARADQLGEPSRRRTSPGQSSRADKGRLDAQLASATQRAEEASARADRSDAARAASDGERTAADKSATRLEAQLEQARTRLAELSDERNQVSADLSDATARAVRAETRIPTASTGGPHSRDTAAAPPTRRRGGKS